MHQSRYSKSEGYSLRFVDEGNFRMEWDKSNLATILREIHQLLFE